MIVAWIIFPIAHRKAKVRLQKGEKGRKESLSENIEENYQSAHQKKDSWGLSPT